MDVGSDNRFARQWVDEGERIEKSGQVADDCTME
jgi:hypothetical protein